MDELKIEGSPKECKLRMILSITTRQRQTSLLPSSDRDSDTRSGNTTSRFFCGDCGSPIHTQGPLRLGHTVVKMGLFAKQGLKYKPPVVEIFNVNRNDWEKPIGNARQFDYMHDQ
jgi:hypothetical protein